MSDESIKPPSTSDKSLNPEMNYIDNAKMQVKLNCSCLKQEKVALDNKELVNIYIGYVINFWSYTQCADFTLDSSLIGSC